MTTYIVIFVVQTRLEVDKTQHQRKLNPGVDAGISLFKWRSKNRLCFDKPRHSPKFVA